METEKRERRAETHMRSEKVVRILKQEWNLGPRDSNEGGRRRRERWREGGEGGRPYTSWRGAAEELPRATSCSILGSGRSCEACYCDPASWECHQSDNRTGKSRTVRWCRAIIAQFLAVSSTLHVIVQGRSRPSMREACTGFSAKRRVSPRISSRAFEQLAA